jgi:very-short-patch-repair endonuclease
MPSRSRLGAPGDRFRPEAASGSDVRPRSCLRIFRCLTTCRRGKLRSIRHSARCSSESVSREGRRVTTDTYQRGTRVDEPKAWPAWLRILFALLIGLLGFVFPLFFLAAGFLLWTVYNDVANPTPTSPTWIDPRVSVTANDPNWEQHWSRDCESPAELAFLNAAVEAFGLVPNQGVLQNGDVTLQLQVEIPPYRADFMINDRLVIEIDGQAYHSSPDAVTRDRYRDEAISSKGYTILRIPAKDVFRAPSEVIRRVNRVLAGLEFGELAKSKRSNGFNPLKAITKATDLIDEGFRRMSESAAEEDRRRQEAATEYEKRGQAREALFTAQAYNDPRFQPELDKRVQARMKAEDVKKPPRDPTMDFGALGLDFWTAEKSPDFYDEEFWRLCEEWPTFVADKRPAQNT